MSCKVSIIVPVYNVEKYLRKCLDSLINQTLKDIEIIIVDDGSTDSSPDIIAEFAQKDSRIKTIRQKNSKLGATRNNGMKLATGEYLGFVDSDDYVDENFFEELYLTAINSQADIVAANILKHKPKYNKYNLHYKKTLQTADIQKKIKLCSDTTNRFFSCWNKIYKRELITKYNLEFTVNRIHEDVIFSTKALYYSNILAVTPNTTYHYMQNPNSICNTKKGNNAKGVDKIYNYKQMQIFAKDHDIKLPERMNYYNSYWSSPIIKSYVGYYTVKEKLFGLIPLNLQLSKILKQTFNIIDEDTKIKLVIFGIQITIPSSSSTKKLKESPYLDYKKNNIEITKLPKAEGQVRDLQLADLALLKELDYVCKKNNLQYWLDGGSMLGAVRHNGFIPWDDDIDVGMLREDYEKLIEAFTKTSRNPDIYADFSKDETSRAKQYYIKVQHKKCPHLFVDIFPLDTYGKVLTKVEQLSETVKIKAQRNKCLKFSYPKPMSDNELLTRINLLRDRILAKGNKEEHSDFVWGVEFSHIWKNWFSAYDVIFPLKTIEFEGLTVPCINNPDAYLTRLYGKYMGYPKKIGYGHNAYADLSEEEKQIIKTLIQE